MLIIDCHAHILSADEKRYPPRDHPLRPFDPDDPPSPGEEGRNGDPAPVVARPSWPGPFTGETPVPRAWRRHPVFDICVRRAAVEEIADMRENALRTQDARQDKLQSRAPRHTAGISRYGGVHRGQWQATRLSAAIRRDGGHFHG